MLSLVSHWNCLDSRKKKRIYFGMMTFLFIVISILCFGYFFKNDRSFFWVGGGKDGLSQNYNCLVYFSHYLKQIFENIFVNHSFVIPQWEFGLGYGADIITTTGFVTIGDIFNWFSVFVPESGIHIFYHVMGFLRLYLAGVSFSFYCFRMNKRMIPTLIGTLIYVFSGYALINLPREVFFINPMIYLPLLLIGAEKILNNEKPYIFIIAIFLSIIGSFQFFYILCIGTFVYTFIRFFMKYKERVFCSFVSMFCRFIIYGLIGVMLGSFIFIPTILRFLSDSRAGLGGFDWLYPINYYKLILPSFISYQIPGGSTTHLVMTPFIFISIISLLLNFKKKYFAISIVLIFAFLFVLFPIGGYSMNGLSIPSNRWIFIFSFILSYIFVYTFEMLFTYTFKQLIIINLLFIIFFIWCFIILGSKFNYTLYSLLILGCGILLLDIYNFIKLKNSSIYYYTYSVAIFLIVVIGFISNSYFINSRNYGNHPSQFLNYSQAYSTLKGSGINAISKINDNSFYRYEDLNTGTKSFYNSGLNYHKGSPNYFFSLSNPHIQKFYNILDIGSGNPLYFEKLNCRLILQSLSSVKYMSASDELKSKLDQNKLIQTSSENTENVNIYENTYSLPIGYTYNNSIAFNEFNKYNVVDKQKIMLDYLVVDESKESDKSFDETQPLQYKLELGDGVVNEDGKFIVKKKKAKVKLNFMPTKTDELYVSFRNFSYQSICPLNYYSDGELQNISPKEKINYHFWQPKNSTTVTVKGEVNESIQLRTTDNIYYNPQKKDYSINVKSINQKDNSITIEFSNIGEYFYDNIDVFPLSLVSLEKKINALKSESLENILIQDNMLSGNITTDTDKLLCITIPYTDGWTAYVDGIETEIVPANIMYMGLKVKSGTHHIVLRYTTPGLKMGMAISTLGIAALIFVFCQSRIKNKSQSKSLLKSRVKFIKNKI